MGIWSRIDKQRLAALGVITIVTMSTGSVFGGEDNGWSSWEDAPDDSVNSDLLEAYERTYVDGQSVTGGEYDDAPCPGSSAKEKVSYVRVEYSCSFKSSCGPERSESRTSGSSYSFKRYRCEQNFNAGAFRWVLEDTCRVESNYLPVCKIRERNTNCGDDCSPQDATIQQARWEGGKFSDNCNEMALVSPPDDPISFPSLLASVSSSRVPRRTEVRAPSQPKAKSRIRELFSRATDSRGKINQQRLVEDAKAFNRDLESVGFKLEATIDAGGTIQGFQLVMGGHTASGASLSGAYQASGLEQRMPNKQPMSVNRCSVDEIIFAAPSIPGLSPEQANQCDFRPKCPGNCVPGGPQFCP